MVQWCKSEDFWEKLEVVSLIAIFLSGPDTVVMSVALLLAQVARILVPLKLAHSFLESDTGTLGTVF